MQHRLIVASLVAVFAAVASPASAQFLKSNVNSDESVRPVACHDEVSGCAGCGARTADACCCVAGDCSAGHLGNIGPCGPGGNASGDCLPRCYSAPFTRTLYRNCCYGPCGQARCCKTIFGEMAMDVRRWWLGRGSCGIGCSTSDPHLGGFFGRGLGSGLFQAPLGSLACGINTGSGESLLESSCGCEIAGCTGDCAAEQICTDPACGCESAGCSGDVSGKSAGCAAGPVILESSCGCETLGCSGDCVSTASSQEICCPSGGRGLLGSIGGLLFGTPCEAGFCPSGDCSSEISCGVEGVGCAANEPTTKPLEEPLRSQLVSRLALRKLVRSQTSRSRQAIPSATEANVLDVRHEIKQVGHVRPTGPQQRIVRQRD